MDWTAMGAPPPILTEPTRICLVLFRVIFMEQLVQVTTDPTETRLNNSLAF